MTQTGPHCHTCSHWQGDRCALGYEADEAWLYLWRRTKRQLLPEMKSNPLYVFALDCPDYTQEVARAAD